MKKYDQKILRTAIPAFVISAICYAVMWGIMTRTENTFFAGYIGGGGEVSQIRNILICVLVGAILFVLPLEKICDKTYGAVRHCGSLFTDKKKFRDAAALFVLTLLYVVICWASVTFSIHTYSGLDDGGHWGLFGSGSDEIYAVVITILAFVVMVKGVDLVKKSWSGVLFWFLIELANAVSVKLVTAKDDLTFAIVCTETVMFIVYVAVQHRLNVVTCMLSLLCGALLIFAGCDDVFTSKNKISGSSIMDELDQTGSMPDQIFGARYNITIIKHQAGIGLCILWFILLVILSIAVVATAAKLMKVSARRGTFVLGIYMIEAFLIIYAILAEMGFIKPAVTLLLHMDEVVPVMILGFRMFFRLPADAGSNSENVKTNV